MVFASIGTGLGPLLAQPERVDVSSLFCGYVLFALAVLDVPLVARRHWQGHAARTAQGRPAVNAPGNVGSCYLVPDPARAGVSRPWTRACHCGPQDLPLLAGTCG